MDFTKTLAAGTFLAAALVAGTAFAKGHDNGFGAQAAGTEAFRQGAVAEGVRNNEKGDGSASAYGRTGVQTKIADGSISNSEDAQDRDDTDPGTGVGGDGDSCHPSQGC